MLSLKVRDYMLQRAVTLSPDCSVVAAVDKFLHSNQFGAPVVDKSGRVLGWVSEQDCLAVMLEEAYHCEQVALVSDVMRHEVLSVGPDTPVLEVARLMLEQKPKIYPVVEEGRLLGVINRHQVMQAIREQLQQCFVRGAH